MLRCKITCYQYSLFCLTKAVTLLSHLWLNHSYWDPKRTLHHLWCRTQLSGVDDFLIQALQNVIQTAARDLFRSLVNVFSPSSVIIKKELTFFMSRPAESQDITKVSETEHNGILQHLSCSLIYTFVAGESSSSISLYIRWLCERKPTRCSKRLRPAVLMLPCHDMCFNGNIEISELVSEGNPRRKSRTH